MALLPVDELRKPNPAEACRLGFVFRDETVGQPYRIQTSTNLAEGWLDWQSFDYTSPLGFLDFSVAGATNRFYRAIAP